MNGRQIFPRGRDQRGPQTFFLLLFGLLQLFEVCVPLAQFAQESDIIGVKMNGVGSINQTKILSDEKRTYRSI